jgi:hypothetical protein
MQIYTKNIITISILYFLCSVINTNFTYADINMIVQKTIMKTPQPLEANRIYYQYDFKSFRHKEDSSPAEGKLFLSPATLETDPDDDIALQEISQIILNENKQYREVTKIRRNIIEILYPTEPFETLEDGIHFYILNKDNQLQKKENFEAVFKEPGYIRVEKLDGKVISIQKRPIYMIIHFNYEYWPNQNLKYDKLEYYNNEHQIIYYDETFYDENEKIITGNKKNLLTRRNIRYTYINKDGISRVDEYFDSQGNKTNHVIYYDNTNAEDKIENQILDHEGKLVAISNTVPDDIFDPLKEELAESYPYNNLLMDIEKTDVVLTEKFFLHTVDKNTTQWDNEAINRAKYLRITPNQPYYAKVTYPLFWPNRYKNFPHQKPLTLIEAEHQQPNAKYSDLIQFEVGNNYQYKTLIKEKWQQTPITLPLEQFKPLENDIYFFVMDNNGKLIPLENVEQAVEQPNYIRVEKEMGKIISIVKKTRIYKVLNEFEYQDNSLKNSKFNLLESTLLPNLIIETKWENYLPKYQVIKDNQGITVRTITVINPTDFHAIFEEFNSNGIKTNRIEINKNNDPDIINQYLDEKGQLIKTTDDYPEKDSVYDKIYKEPFYPIFIDQLEYQLFKLYQRELEND